MVPSLTCSFSQHYLHIPHDCLSNWTIYCYLNLGFSAFGHGPCFVRKKQALELAGFVLSLDI